MSQLSAERSTRWFKKSASEQYHFAKVMSPAQRGDLERCLEARFRSPGDPQAERALDMWLSVQQARLRTHGDGQRSEHRLQMLLKVALPAATVLGAGLGAACFHQGRQDYYASRDRPEYATAFDNFMRIIGDGALPMDVRMTAARRLAYHAQREGTIADAESLQLSMRHAGAQPAAAIVPVDALAVQRPLASLPADEPFLLEIMGAFALAGTGHRLSKNPNAVTVHSVAEDVQQGSTQLGAQMNAWLREAGLPGLKSASAFNGERYADSFARVLERRMPAASIANATITNRHELAVEGAMVIHAIADSTDLRALVFAMAETALGDCGDNVAEGFSEIVHAVRNHQMETAVRQGRVGLEALNGWGRAQFRLDVLDREINRFIDRAKAETAALVAEKRDALSPGMRALGMSEEAIVASMARPVAVSEVDILAEVDDLVAAAGGTAESLTLREQVATAINELREIEWKMTRLTNEPVETRLHAKVELGAALGLEGYVSQGLGHRGVSVMTQADIDVLRSTVQTSEADPKALKDFLVRNDIWLRSMKHLHAHEFEALGERFGEDPFHGLDLPRDGDEHLEELTAYVEAAQDFLRRKTRAEHALAARCAGLGGTSLAQLMREEV
ncbi:NEL-type E3 ubiquitin ligase domain-containing protein [Rhizobacter sp. Root1221]|uniref:NEL-type E3 ubiquitin ligase domain-containing protein n=1 Tax=Rhizobacter sp. Root1221 TaxID=1736433 RepID=UPI0006FB8648|nr:NEL-type E3 ubiquitin ligase domain-containing protein [Rhizobacter sp. Root1221]KQV81260.1 hypothetical protein ASC87_10055 [Rhizobacter sp. Root1221]